MEALAADLNVGLLAQTDRSPDGGNRLQLFRFVGHLPAQEGERGALTT